ncbi:DUF4936 family protein [Sphaerotilus sp.]|uniref:DUF4936 family protein n=1 Tax=Sphaerotilus sp. TaxID=2093942 RepID=UPI0034E25066
MTMTCAEDGEHHGELYIYYRVRHADSGQARTEMAAAHETLRQRFPTLESRWLQRLEDRDEMLTWMEIHRQPGGLDAPTVAHICEMLLPWPSVRVGPRHVEVFASLPVRGVL